MENIPFVDGIEQSKIGIPGLPENSDKLWLVCLIPFRRQKADSLGINPLSGIHANGLPF
jgi:hypothetical protein